MTISPELKPPVAITSEPEVYVPFATKVSPMAGRDRTGRNANTSMPYIFVVIALVVIGYIGYSFYWSATSPTVQATQSSTTVVPQVVPVPSATPPSGSATSPVAPVAPLVVPAPPPATTTTP